jgi:hypothetical protein
MVGQLVRAVEAPMSLSITVARKGAVLAGRVAGWALTETMRQLSPDRREEAFAPAADESASSWEPLRVDATVQEAPVSAIEEEGDLIAVTAEEPEIASPSADEGETLGEAEPDSPSAEEAEPEPVGRAGLGTSVGVGTSVGARDPHSALNNPVTEADLTEWPDPYDHREDPRDPGDEMVFGGKAGHTQTGATSTSEPHPSQDPEAEPWEGPKRDKVDR